MKKFWFLFSCIALPWLNGCSSLLYYPTHQLHLPPERYGFHPQEIHFSSADGTKLFGWLFQNETKKKPKGVLLFYHGNGENLSSHYISLLWILKQNYDFFIFDYRGYGRSEGDPSPKGTVQDGEAALRWLRKRYPDSPLYIFAQSLGGAVGLRNAIDLKDETKLRGVIVESGFASYQEVARKIMARGIISWPFQWLAWLAFQDKYAPDGRIATISPLPLLVFHAENDEVVPFSCGENIFQQGAEPKEFWKIPGKGHANALLNFGDTYQKKLLEWLARH